MRVQKDYAFNLALLQIKQEAARCISMKKYTRSILFAQALIPLFLSPKIHSKQGVFIIML